MMCNTIQRKVMYTQVLLGNFYPFLIMLRQAFVVGPVRLFVQPVVGRRVSVCLGYIISLLQNFEGGGMEEGRDNGYTERRVEMNRRY